MTFWVYQSYSICKKLLNSYPIFIKQKVIISMRIALSEVVERYQRNIYVAAYAIVRNSDDANDVVQDYVSAILYEKYASLKVKSI